MEKLKEFFSKLFGGIKNRWTAASRNARLVISGVAGAVVIATVALIVISGNTNYEMLYPGVATTEISEISAALRDEVGISNFIVENGNILVPKEEIDRARMELAIMGYPKSSFNYNVWNEGINMFSTDAERRETQRQQLEQNIRATFRASPKITDADIIVTLPEQQRYVLNPESAPSQCSVRLTLAPGVKLTNEEIQGIEWHIITSVPQLDIENFSLTDQNMAPLVAEDGISGELQLEIEMNRLRQQRMFKLMLENDIEETVRKLLQGTVRNFTVGVTAVIDYSDWSEIFEEFTGSNVDENGHQTGILENEKLHVAWNGINAEGGLVGTETNADISPDYPAYVGEVGTEAYHERMEESSYLVNKYQKQGQSNGFLIEAVFCAVQIDEGALPQDVIDEYERLISRAIATDIENVAVMPTNFIIQSPEYTDYGTTVSPMRNLLVFIIIALGALLIILFMLAIMSSGSKKRRLVKAKQLALAQGAGAMPAFADEGVGAFALAKPEEEDEHLKIQSLLGSSDGETREGLLKNEIREFAKTNPEIVAQLIRTWIRE